MIELVILGDPIAKKRPQFSRKGDFVQTFNDQETKEGRFLWEVKNQWRGEPMIGPLRLSMTFSMKIPSSVSKKIQSAISAGEYQHTKKPDLDNLIKFTLDCLNGIVWLDDKQIVMISAAKVYSSTASTNISITEYKAEKEINPLPPGE